MTNKTPFGKARIGQYELAAWENEAKVNNNTIKKLGYTLSRSYKVGEEWKNQIINLSGIKDVRELATIMIELSSKATKIHEAFNETKPKEDKVEVQKF